MSRFRQYAWVAMWSLPFIVPTGVVVYVLYRVADAPCVQYLTHVCP